MATEGEGAPAAAREMPAPRPSDRELLDQLKWPEPAWFVLGGANTAPGMIQTHLRPLVLTARLGPPDVQKQARQPVDI